MDAGPSSRVNILTDKKEYRRGLKDLYHSTILPPAVFVTTVTDVLGFFFLGLATLFINYLI